MKFFIVFFLLSCCKYFPIIVPVTPLPLPLPVNDTDSVVLKSQGRLDNIEERGSAFQGDILGVDDETLKARAGVLDERLRWPENTVVYYISSAFDTVEKDVIRNATNWISNSTCIQFLELQSRPVFASIDYVFVIKVPDGCSSNVGRIGGRQTLHLGPGCVIPGTIAHEFIHALGFHHEQSRSDRDDYVRIFQANIPRKHRGNFEKYPPWIVYDFEVPYDYGSVMHYSEYAFSRDGISKTLEPKLNYSGRIGQRDALSDKDIQKILNMYCVDSVDAVIPEIKTLVPIIAFSVLLKAILF